MAIKIYVGNKTNVSTPATITTDRGLAYYVCDTEAELLAITDAQVLRGELACTLDTQKFWCVTGPAGQPFLAVPDQAAMDLKANLAGPVTYSGTHTFTTVNISDLAISGGGSANLSLGLVTLPSNTVTLAQQKNVATGTVFYRRTAGTGSPEVQTLATLKQDLNLANIPGMDGEDGDQGWPGVAGVNGTAGTPGVTGSQGAPGLDGEDNSDSWPTMSGHGILAHQGFPGGTATFLRADGAFASPTAAASISQTEIDFGTLPVSNASFTIVDAAVTLSSRLLAQVAYEAPTGKDVDEIEMDDLQLRCQAGTGQFLLFAQASDGSYLADKFKINYQVGA